MKRLFLCLRVKFLGAIPMYELYARFHPIDLKRRLQSVDCDQSEMQYPIATETSQAKNDSLQVIPPREQLYIFITICSIYLLTFFVIHHTDARVRDVCLYFGDLLLQSERGLDLYVELCIGKQSVPSVLIFHHLREVNKVKFA
jgi:hypothetical protein